MWPNPLDVLTRRKTGADRRREELTEDGWCDRNSASQHDADDQVFP